METMAGRIDIDAPRRVLFLARFLDQGGVTSHMMTLGTGLRKKGVEVAIASRGRVEDHTHGPDWFRAEGIRHYAVRFPLRECSLQSAADALHAVGGLRRVLKEYRPDLVHAHWRSITPYTRLIREARNLPLVTTLHVATLPASIIHRSLSFWGNRTICLTDEARSHLARAFSVPEAQVRVIPHGVDASYFRPPTPAEQARARSQFNLRADDTAVALIGSLYPNKGHALLFEALSHLRIHGYCTTALLAGTGQIAFIRKTARQFNVEDMIRLLGYVDARTVLWAADALVLPSRQEAFGLTVVEAMLCGVVPIRTHSPGSEGQIQDGITGFLVPQDDAAALARRLEHVLSNEEVRTRMGRVARKAAEESFAQQRMVEQTLAVYAEARAAF